MDMTEVSFDFLLNHDHFAYEELGQQSDSLNYWAPLPLTTSELNEENAAQHWKNNSELSMNDYLGDENIDAKQECSWLARAAEREKQEASTVPN